MRVIFLDIDGVICCNQLGRLEDKKLHLLRSVVLATGAKIVLSTDWRRIPKLKQQLVQTLHEYGCEVIGATPMRAPWHPVRPVEIIDWLRAYNEAAVQRADTEPITSFVAVDDRALLQESGGDELIGRFVHTRNMTGLTDKAAERMKQVLLSGGDRDAPSIPGLGVRSPGSAGRASFSSSVGGSGATMSVEVPMAAEIHSSNGVSLGTPFKDSMMSALSAAGGLPRGRPAPLVTSAMPFRSDATEIGSPEPRAEPKSSMSTYDALGMGGTPLRVGGSVSIFAGASPTSNRIAPTPAFNTLRGQTAGRSPLSPFGAPVRGANVDGSRMLPNLDGTRATVQARSIRSQTANVNGFGARGGSNTSQLQAYGSSYRAPTTLRPGGAY